jgi:hypothetical protein
MPTSCEPGHPRIPRWRRAWNARGYRSLYEPLGGSCRNRGQNEECIVATQEDGDAVPYASAGISNPGSCQFRSTDTPCKHGTGNSGHWGIVEAGFFQRGPMGRLSRKSSHALADEAV